MASDLPSYDDLPATPGAPPGSSWGVWGDDDKLGCLNLLTPERIAAAAALVKRGKTFALNLELDLPDPPLFGRAAPTHEVLGTDGHDDLLAFNTQSSSQWDGFRHIRHPEYGHYNGVADDDHGIHHWATGGIVGRAVLADVARHRTVAPDTADPITPDDIEAALQAQGTELREGDVLLLRTGWLAWYRTLDQPERVNLASGFAAPGIRAHEDTARWLWDHHVAAIAADNPAVETWPPASRKDFLHYRLLPLLGLPLGELWDLDALAADCAADGAYEGFFTSAPLRVRGGVASPPNAIFVK
jgi:kynurenine formamidase